MSQLADEHTDTEDATLFIAGDYLDTLTTLGPANYTSFLQDSFGAAASTVEKYLPISTFKSTPLPAFYAISYISTAVSYRCPAYRGLVAAAKKGIPVWTYQFEHIDTCQWIADVPDSQEAFDLLGPTHTAEIPFIFANLDHMLLPDGNCSFNSEERQLSADLVSAWTSMASTGNPSNSQVIWPAWNASASLGITIVNSTIPSVVNYTICELFDTIALEQINGTLGADNSSSSATASVSTSATASASATASSANSGSASVLKGLEAFSLKIGLEIVVLAGFYALI
jgi:hypothetical protein